jgi:hypothetical protein
MHINPSYLQEIFTASEKRQVSEQKPFFMAPVSGMCPPGRGDGIHFSC